MTDDRAALAAPATEAGRRLLARLDGMMEGLSADPDARQRYHDGDVADIRAIEAEARALPPDPERLVVALRATAACTDRCDHDGIEWHSLSVESLAAAIIAAWPSDD